MAEAVWVHGNAGQIEDPAVIDASVSRFGFEVSAPGHNEGAIYYPLPTTTVRDGVRARVTALHFLGETNLGFLRGFDLYDGKKLVASFAAPKEHSTHQFDLTLPLPSPLIIETALCFVVYFEGDGVETNGVYLSAGGVTIYAVGADFEYVALPGDATVDKNLPGAPIKDFPQK
jgi:hypothetical protein